MRKTLTERKTKETDISLMINLDGRGDNPSVKTPIPFLDHMLTLLFRHGLIEARLRAKGDVDVDYHHTVEDIGLVLGKAVKDALGDMKGIKRYGFASVPMDESLAQVSVDISGRPFLVYRTQMPPRAKIKNFDVGLIEDFLQAFSSSGGITLHVQAPYGRNVHHMAEAIFKALGRALMEAVSIEHRARKEIPSTKGRL